MRLIQEKGFLEKVFEALQEGVVILAADGSIMFFNRAAGRFFGVNPAETVGKRLDQALGRSLPGFDWASMTVAKGVVSRDLEVFYPESRVLNLYASPINDEGELPGPEDDQRVGTVLLIRDLTQNRRMTEEMIESERLNALTLLAAGVAHELGNPLNSLNIHLQLLERKLRRHSPEAQSAVREQLEVARGEIKRLDFIISQFLSAIRPSRAVLEPENVNQLLQEAVRFLEPEITDRRVQLRLELRDELPLLKADGGQLKQAFYNLIKNACQATPPGGLLTVKTDINDYEILISFSDTGTGISPEHMGHLFEPFSTTKQGGTGLGLLIVRRIVREHGGEIEIQSQGSGLGAAGLTGTCITLHLPLGPRLPRMLGPGLV
jgi:two-component system, sporulation sensor kinase E